MPFSAGQVPKQCLRLLQVFLLPIWVAKFTHFPRLGWQTSHPQNRHFLIRAKAHVLLESQQSWLSTALTQEHVCYAWLLNVSNSLWPQGPYPARLLIHGDSLGKNTGLGWHVLLQGIFPTQGLNPGLLHCRRILYHLSHKGSPRILEWVAYPFSRGSSQPRNQTGVFYIAGGFFTSWATKEVPDTRRNRSKFSLPTLEAFRLSIPVTRNWMAMSF